MSKNRSNPRRYRLDFISENTFNRVWTIRMGRARVILVSAGCIAALAAMVYVILAYTPLRRLMPGALDSDLRSRYVATALRVDSLERVVSAERTYVENLVAIISGQETDSTDYTAVDMPVTAAPGDTLPAAGEAERAFVRAYDEENRFNLSVLAPIAAEGMVFGSPLSTAVHAIPVAGGGVSVNPRRAVPVAATYRGTVTGVYHNPDGTSTIVVQHPNDFVSVYGGVGDVFVERGQRVSPGQRLAHTSTRVPLVFELWHNGTALDPREYMAF